MNGNENNRNSLPDAEFPQLITFFGLLFLILPPVFAESVVEQWVARYNGTGNYIDEANTVAVDSNGNVLVTGRSFSGLGGTSDYYTAKYSATNGALLWEKRYDGPGNYIDEATAIAVDSAGNAIVTGYSYGASGVTDFYTAKYAASDGVLLWERRYNGPANKADSAHAITTDSVGNVFVTGESYSANNTADYYTAKYAAADGALVWEQRYNGPANNSDTANAIAVNGAGDVVVTGQSAGNGSGWDYCTLKYAALDGSIVWEKRYNGPKNNSDRALAVVLDSVGNAIVTGERGVEV